MAPNIALEPSRLLSVVTCRPARAAQRDHQAAMPQCRCTVLNPETALASLRDTETPMTGA